MFDLGTLVVRMTSIGRGQVESDIVATGAALGGAGAKADALGASMVASGAKTSTFGKQVKQAGAELTYLSNEGKAAFTTIGTSVVVAGALVAAGLGLAVVKSVEYNHAISESQAVTGAYGDELDRIRSLTLELGTRTIFNATQAADGVIQLGKAGVSTSDILSGALVGALNLAAAGEVSVGDAAETAAATMVQFKLQGKDIPHIADVLTAAANKSLGGVGDLQYAMEQGATVASSYGISLEETVGTLADFASHGIIGSMAGASFKQMLLSLATPTQAQTALLEKYNIQAYDQQGNFVGIASLAGQLQNGFARATQAERDMALGTLFGSRAIQAATILYKDGASGITDWTHKVNDAGYAAKIAATNQDNLAGDLKKLEGAFDTALIKTGNQASGVLRSVAQGLEGIVNGFSALDPGMQSFVVVGGTVVAITLLVGGGFLLAVPKVLAFREAMATLRSEASTGVGVLGRTASFLTGPWGAALGVAGLAVSTFMVVQQQADQQAQAYAQTLDDVTGNITDASYKIAQDALSAGQQWSFLWGDFSGQSAYAAAKKLGLNLDTVTNAALGNKKALSSVNGELKAGNDYLFKNAGSLAEVDAAAKKVGLSEGDYLNAVRAVSNGLADQNGAVASAVKTQKLKIEADKEAAASGNSAADAAQNDASKLAELQGAASDAGAQVDDLASKIKGFGSTSLDARSAERDFQAAIDDLTQSVKDNGTTLDIGTEKGRANQAALDQIAQSAINAASAIYTQTGNQVAATQAIADGRQALIDSLAQFGITGQAAQDYADQLGLIPGNIDTLFTLNGVVKAQPIDDALARWGTSLMILEDRFGTTNAAAAAQASRLAGYAAAYAKAHPNADGNVLTFAGGGLTEQHIAQIAPAGAMRVWAEPETGGEGYVPLAESKRVRSEQIMTAIAGRFGGVYIPGGSKFFANGGAPSSPKGGAMRIVGQLDLGNGLVGMIDGQISDALDAQETARDRGKR